MLRNSIISLGQLDESGSCVEIKDGVMRIWDHHHRLLAKVTRGTNRLYIPNVQVAQPLCLAARWDDEVWQWHERFGHLHFEALKWLGAKGMVRGLLSLDHVEEFYDVELSSQGAARARARGPVWPGDTGYTWRTMILHAAH
jgi:hypothetical protein